MVCYFRPRNEAGLSLSVVWGASLDAAALLDAVALSDFIAFAPKNSTSTMTMASMMHTVDVLFHIVL